MNCCDQTMPNGCNQGRDCPVRRSRVTSEQTAEAARLMDAGQASQDKLLSEAGNVWFARPDRGNDTEADPVFFTPVDIVFLSVVCAVSIGIWCVGLGVVAGYVWTRWLADLFVSLAGWLVLP